MWMKFLPGHCLKWAANSLAGHGKKVEANHQIHIETLKAMHAASEGARENSFLRQPTAEELASVTFAELREVRIHTQELLNQFAHLLNRGSSLE
jgi:hypothetical protein